MADAFEVLLSLGTGFASGSLKRKRENELIELDNKQKEQTIRTNRIGSIEKSLLQLFGTGNFSAESMLSAIQSVPQLVDDERGAESFGELERVPEADKDPSKRELFQENKRQFTEKEARLERNETFDRSIARQTRDVAQQTRDAAVKSAEFARKREVGDTFKEEIDDIDSQIKENNRLIKDIDTTQEDVNAAKIRNRGLRKSLSEKSAARTRLRITLQPRITSKNINSKIDALKKFISSGAITVEGAISQFKERLKKQVINKEMTSDEAVALTQKLRRELGGS